MKIRRFWIGYHPRDVFHAEKGMIRKISELKHHFMQQLSDFKKEQSQSLARLAQLKAEKERLLKKEANSKDGK